MAVPLSIDEDRLRRELKELLDEDQADGAGDKRENGRGTGRSTGEKDGNSNVVALIGHSNERPGMEGIQEEGELAEKEGQEEELGENEEGDLNLELVGNGSKQGGEGGLA